MIDSAECLIETDDRPKVGILDYAGLKALAANGGEFRVDTLMPERSITILIGDSGLGKTALSMSLGVAVASGGLFLGRGTRQGRVLYCDAESGVAEFARTLSAVSRFAGLTEPPKDFHIWSPNFDPIPHPPDQTVADLLESAVSCVRPDLVIVDPLRAFWPGAEDNSRDAMEMISRMRALSKELGCAWALNHHRRKRNHQNLMKLERDRQIWFEEAAGSLALINGSDTRLGVELSSPHGDLILAGFVRSVGWIGTTVLERTYDDHGEPLGYRVLAGVDQLNDRYRQAFDGLANVFRFKDARAALGGTSDSSTSDMLKQCAALGLLRKTERGYEKQGPGGVSGAKP